MERESEQMQASQAPTLCRSNCGFYGSAATDNMCSLCYKKELKKKQQPPQDARPAVSASPQQQSPTSFIPMSSSSSMETAQPTIPAIPASPSELLLSKDLCADLEGASASSSTAGDDPDASSSKLADDSGSDKDGKGKKKNRCVTCRKKVGLTGFECRCGGLYCSLHRYSDMHECSFDYRELGAQEIRRNNPVVVGEKIQKI